MTNRFAGTCHYCRAGVPAQGGECCHVFAAEGPKLGDEARCVWDGRIGFMGWVGP